MAIVVINNSTSVTDVQGNQMVAAMNMALPAFCSDWSLPAYIAEYVPRGSNKAYPAKLKIFLLDSAPPSAGVLAYHSISGNTPYGNVYCLSLIHI